MKEHVEIRKQDNSIFVPYAGIEYTVKEYSNDAMGGPLDATVIAIGDISDVAQLLRLMRARITIYDDDSEKRWWGFIREILITYAGVEFGFTLDGMANKIQVVYTKVTPGQGGTGESVSTAWSEDADSTALYGTIEKKISMGNASDEVAEQRRDSELAFSAEPTRIFHPQESLEKYATASIVCAGWAESLKWEFYSNSAGIEAYKDTGSGSLKINQQIRMSIYDVDQGDDYFVVSGDKEFYFPATKTFSVVDSTGNDGTYTVTSSSYNGVDERTTIYVDEEIPDSESDGDIVVWGPTAIAQSFQIDAAWDCASIGIKLGKVESPTGTLTLALCSDSGGNPGSTLVSATYDEADLPDSMGWVTFTFASRQALAASTTYWIKLTSTATPSTVNYVSVDVNEDLGYTDGAMKVYDYHLASWVTFSPGDADMLFSVNGESETTEQLSEMFADWQFQSSVKIKDASGVYQNQYRDGEATIYDCIMELLEAGTTNNRRLLFTIDDQLNVVVYEEEAKPSAPINSAYFYYPDGTIHERFGLDISHQAPCGDWCMLHKVHQMEDIGLLHEFVPFFIERAVYDCESERASIEPRKQETVWGYST